jgi:hypothetical protein
LTGNFKKWSIQYYLFVNFSLTLEGLKTLTTIIACLLLLCVLPQNSNAQPGNGKVDFFGVSIQFPATYKAADYSGPLTESSIAGYIHSFDNTALQPYVSALLQYKEQYRPDDWLYYQLVRKVAQHISPKAENYYRYTFYKWWLLSRSGYNAKLLISGNYLLFYVQSDEAIYNIPFRWWMASSSFVLIITTTVPLILQNIALLMSHRFRKALPGLFHTRFINCPTLIRPTMPKKKCSLPMA